MNALMYHDIVAGDADDASGFPGRDAARYKVPPERFASHVDAIRESMAAARQTTPPRFTFDDGGISALVAADLLEARGFTGQFFVTTNYIGTRGFLTAPQIRDLAQRGHIVGSHSCSHPLRMGRCSWPRLVDEWAGSCATLANILGTPIDVASVPGGGFSPQVAEAASRAGITTLYTSEPTGRSRHAFGLNLAGRFTIFNWTTAPTAAALAGNDWLACTRQAVVWNAKKVSKRLGGTRYLQVRRLLLGSSPDVRWGDRR